MRTGKNIDMTKGPILKLVLLFAWPICLGNVLQQLYNTVDTLVIGNYCGSVSLAAVGTSSQPVEIFLSIFLGFGTGISILISQSVGSGNLTALKKTAATCVSFLYLCAIPLTILGLLLGPSILRLMQVPADTMDLSAAYIRIIFLGTLGNMGYNMNAGILQGLGDSKSTLIFLLISCGVNIVLDIFFVAVLKMDVTGAAVATIIAMFCSWIFSILYIRKKYPELDFSILPRTLDKKILFSIVRIGLPLGLNNSIYSIGHVMIQSLINLQGSAFMASCSVATRLISIANVAINALASSATTFAGQNLGAKQYSRLKKGGTVIPACSGLITLIAGILVTAFCYPLLRFFTKDAEVLELAVLYIRIVMPWTWTYAVFSCIIDFINGMGEIKYPTIINILMLWAVRIPSAWLIAGFIDGKYLTACYPFSYSFGMFCMLAYFFTGKWKKIKQLAAAETEN